MLMSIAFLVLLGMGFAFQKVTSSIETNRNRQSGNEVSIETLETAEIAKAISSWQSSLDGKSIFSFAITIQKESKQYNLDWELVLAIIKVESEFDIRAVSCKGAIGLMQVMPGTAKWVSGKLGLKYRGPGSLCDPDYNIKLGIHYLSMMYQKYGNLEEALVAYNRGPTGLARYVHRGNDLSAGYLEKVMRYYKELKEDSNEYVM